jgi:hypothetical protein
MPDSQNGQTKIFQFANRTLWYSKYQDIMERSANVSVYINATVLKVQTNPSGTVS